MLKIRAYLDEDLNNVVALWHRSWINTFPNLTHPQAFAEWKIRFHDDLSRRGNVWIAETQIQIVGFIVLIKKEGIIDQLFVDSDAQRIGIGTALLNHAKTICVCGLSLTTLQQNNQARKFYEKHGFVAGHAGINPINGQLNIKYKWNPDNQISQ